MTRKTLIATATAIFAAGSFATAAHADGVKCSGVNSCKGTSACKMALVVLQGPERLQGPGLDRDDRRDQLHQAGRQGGAVVTAIVYGEKGAARDRGALFICKSGLRKYCSAAEFLNEARRKRKRQRGFCTSSKV